ncbi:MAG: hypothetical protein K6T83_01860, partial [Alicyclobacillus sp.]|nr:hypothetical protein [Alicyclobacillus sp.]
QTPVGMLYLADGALGVCGPVALTTWVSREYAEELLRQRVDQFTARALVRVEVVARTDRPLRMRGTDPSNLFLLTSTEVLHTRYLRVADEQDMLEVFDACALTVAVGPHPLYDGILQVTVTGLQCEPKVVESAGSVRMECPGLTAQFSQAQIQRAGMVLRVELG